MNRSDFIKKSVFPLLLFPLIAFAWSISPESFHEKISKGPSLWLREKIERELTLFASGVTTHQLQQCLQNLREMQGAETAGLVHIYHANALTQAQPLFNLTIEQTLALENFIQALRILDSIAKLPDFNLILTLCPSFDRPLLLMKTTVPIFAVSKEQHNRKVVLIPRFWSQRRQSRFETLFRQWESKIRKAIYRGATTDGPYRFYDWDFSPRARLALCSRQHPDLIDAALLPSASLGSLMRSWLDRLSLLVPASALEDLCIYKYQLALDGRASPSSLEWQLFTGSLIFKAESNRIEWFYEWLIPGQHYLPFNSDKNDLMQQMLWAQSNDNEAKAIAENGYFFAQNHLRDEDLFLYFYYLLIAYSKLLTPLAPYPPLGA